MTRTLQKPLHTLIEASAGTGKTHQLTNRYIRQLLDGSAPETILATTFTRKAAGEILDRIVQRLAAAALDEREAAQLGQQVGRAGLTRERCAQVLLDVMRHLHRLRIGTLDSFFIQLAGCFSLELDLPPGWTIAEESLERRQKRLAIERLLAADETQQMTTLMSLLKPGEAGRPVAAFVEETVSELHATYLQTSPNAWTVAMPCKPPDDREVEQLIDALANLQGLTPRMDKANKAAIEALENRDWDSFFEKGLAKSILDGKSDFDKKPIPEDVLKLYQRAIDVARRAYVFELQQKTDATRQLLERYQQQLVAIKERDRALRFDDVTDRLRRGIAQWSSDRLGLRLDGDIRHVLLDEFQDTSTAQWQVLRPIIERVATGNRGGSVFCVGDVKQAIYGWRGGVPELFGVLKEQLPQCDRQQLVESYRSAPPIIEAVNKVFRALAELSGDDSDVECLRRWCRAFPEHETKRTELRGYVCLRTARETVNDEKQNDVTLQCAADHVAELLAQLGDRRLSIGVLVRTNDAVATVINHLRVKGIVASQEGGNSLLDSAAVQLLLSLLKLADHPGDRVARYHLAQSVLANEVSLTSADDDDAAERCAARIRRQLQYDGYGATLAVWARRLAEHCDRRERNRLEQLVCHGRFVRAAGDPAGPRLHPARQKHAGGGSAGRTRARDDNPSGQRLAVRRRRVDGAGLRLDPGRQNRCRSIAARWAGGPRV